MSITTGSASFYRRVKIACAANDTTPSGLARSIGISQGAFFRIVTGRGKSKITFPKILRYVEDYESKIPAKKVG
ncbi:MAG: hypothetical protein LCH54_15785 [Bacteroidetes bacterium]|nr:hypothetical protein [Bacteroidota bacterium]